MSIDGKMYDRNSGVRRVILTTLPELNPLSYAPNANQNYYCYGNDMKGFQIQIDLQALPGGVTIDQLRSNQVWWVEKRTTLYRIYLYAGVFDPSTRQINSTTPLPPPVANRYFVNYYSNSTQTTAGSGVINHVAFNNTSNSLGFTVDSGTSSKITAQNSGNYNITFHAQFGSSVTSGTVVETINTWIRHNGSDVPGSNNQFTSQTTSGTIVYGINPISFSYPLNLNAGDYFQVMWAANSSTAVLEANNSPIAGPSVPSASVIASLL